MPRISNIKRKLDSDQSQELLTLLKSRFEKNKNRHKGLEWDKVQAKLESQPEKLWSLHQMENSGGEPDVVGYDKKTGEFLFYDCSAESPKGLQNSFRIQYFLQVGKTYLPGRLHIFCLLNKNIIGII